jgi:hypothetical protein
MANLENSVNHLHYLTRSRNPNVRQQIDACIHGYIKGAAPNVAEAKDELASAFQAYPTDEAADAELTAYVLHRLGV